MTPQEKAKELVDKFEEIECPTYDGWGGRAEMDLEAAKACAMIAIELVIDLPCIWISKNLADENGTPEESLEYWEDVKNEIQKL